MVVVLVTSPNLSLDADSTDFGIVDAAINLDYAFAVFLVTDPENVSVFVLVNDRYFDVAVFVAINLAIVLVFLLVISLHFFLIFALVNVYEVAINRVYVSFFVWVINPDFF